MPVNVLDLWQYYQKTCHTGQEKWHRVMQPFSHPYHLCLIMDRHLLIQYFYSDGPLIRWHPFVVNRPGIIYLWFLQISQHALAHPIHWVGGIKLMELYMSRTAASEQPSDNFAGLFVDFLVDEGNSSPVINYHSVHCLDFLSHNCVFKDNWSNLYPISQPKGLCFSGCIPKSQHV